MPGTCSVALAFRLADEGLRAPGMFVSGTL